MGIEWAGKFYRHAVDRIGRWGLTHVRIIRTDAATFLAESVPAESVACLHIYFPDPWPKRRQHKRRLIQSANMAALIRCLERGGRLQLATDHAEYFAQMKATVASCRDMLEPTDFIRPAGAGQGEVTGTNYERKYLKEGTHHLYPGGQEETSHLADRSGIGEIREEYLLDQALGSGDVGAAFDEPPVAGLVAFGADIIEGPFLRERLDRHPSGEGCRYAGTNRPSPPPTAARTDRSRR